jgi:hypothetical protein
MRSHPLGHARNHSVFLGEGYMSQILPMLAQGFYSEPLQFDRLPSGLEAYYQSHWQHITGKGLSSVELGVLHCLATPQPPLASPRPSSLNLRLKKEGISAEALSKAMPAGLIAKMIDEDEYDVEAVLENWIEFLQQQRIEGEIRPLT